jgi:mRNA interferase MazF
MAFRRGDIIMLDFDPASGYEQKGYRPALVISPEIFNQKTPFTIVCPITSKKKGNIFEVSLPESDDEHKVQGVVLVHHVKSLDLKSRKRNVRVVDEAPNEVVQEVLNKLKPLVT